MGQSRLTNSSLPITAHQFTTYQSHSPTHPLPITAPQFTTCQSQLTNSPPANHSSPIHPPANHKLTVGYLCFAGGGDPCPRWSMLSLFHQLSAHCLYQEQQDVLSPETMNTTSRDGADKISTSKLFTESLLNLSHSMRLCTCVRGDCLARWGEGHGG